MGLDYNITSEIINIFDLLHKFNIINKTESNIEQVRNRYSQSHKDFWGARQDIKLTFLAIDSGKDTIPFNTKYKLNDTEYTINLEMTLFFYGKRLSNLAFNDPFEHYQFNLIFKAFRKNTPQDKYFASWHLDKHKRINKITQQDLEKLKNKITDEIIEKLENALSKLPKTGEHNEISNLEYQQLLSDNGLDKKSLSLIFELLESDNFAHPEYHFHFGGKNLHEHRNKFGNILVIDSPRIMHYPMDFPLAVHFILTNFYSREKRHNLVNNPTYIKIIKNAKERVLRPYFSSIVNNWDSNPENPFHFSYITGIK